MSSIYPLPTTTTPSSPKPLHNSCALPWQGRSRYCTAWRYYYHSFIPDWSDSNMKPLSGFFIEFAHYSLVQSLFSTLWSMYCLCTTYRHTSAFNKVNFCREHCLSAFAISLAVLTDLLTMPVTSDCYSILFMADSCRSDRWPANIPVRILKNYIHCMRDIIEQAFLSNSEVSNPGPQGSPVLHVLDVSWSNTPGWMNGHSQINGR